MDLTSAGHQDHMCGDTLKVLYKPQKCIFLRLETGNKAFVVIFFSLFPVEWAPCDACLLGCLA